MTQSKPIPIMHIIEKDNQKFIVNDYKSSDKIFLHPEVADRKIVVFLTLGAFRKGKSFLLDYCLRFLYANYRSINNPGHWCPTEDWLGSPDQPLSGFSWKHGRYADTKGIIMWSDVFLHDTPSGEKLAIVVMDTQGLFEGGSTSDENARIFSLSTLIASIQIINIQHLIQEDQLEYLNMAVILSQMILEKIQSEGDGEFSKFFQKLVFLMRDWADDRLELGYAGGDLYLAETLSKSFKSKAAMSVREHICESFDEVKCCLLPHPGLIVNKSDFDGSYGKLDAKFVTSLKEFIESMLAPQNLKVKSILGQEVTGREFRSYLNSYFEAFQSEEIPKVESVLDVIVQKQICAIIETCVQAYHRETKNLQINFEFDDRDEFCESLLQIHNMTKGKVMQILKNVPKLQSSCEDFEAKLTARIGVFFEEWKTDNLKHFDTTIKFKQDLKKMKINEEELKRKMEEFEEQVRIESEENAEALAKAEQEAEELRQREELLKNQIKELKKRRFIFFKIVGATIDKSLELVSDIFRGISPDLGPV